MNTEICTIIATGIGVVGLLYTYIRNFRADMNDKFEKSEKRWMEANKRIDESNRRMDGVYHILLKRIKEE